MASPSKIKNKNWHPYVNVNCKTLAHYLEGPESRNCIYFNRKQGCFRTPEEKEKKNASQDIYFKKVGVWR